MYNLSAVDLKVAAMTRVWIPWWNEEILLLVLSTVLLKNARKAFCPALNKIDFYTWLSTYLLVFKFFYNCICTRR